MILGYENSVFTQAELVTNALNAGWNDLVHFLADYGNNASPLVHRNVHKYMHTLYCVVLKLFLVTLLLLACYIWYDLQIRLTILEIALLP